MVTWLAEGGIKKLHCLPGSKRSTLIFCSFYLIYIVWLINTSDIPSGLQELKIKLPLLALPLAISLSQPLNKQEIRLVIFFFIAGVTISSLTGVILRYGSVLSGISDTRVLSLFIPHAHLAIMSVFAIFCSVWYFYSSPDIRKIFKYTYLVTAIWLTVFLFILLSVTGILLFAFTTFLTIILYAYRSNSRLKRYSLVSILLLLVAVAAIYIVNEIKSFYKESDAYPFPLVQYTANGNLYQHFPDRKDRENGNKVWIYLNEDELKKEWNLRSHLAYDSLDMKGQELRFTLIRYLTSAGLRKDSLGLSSLSSRDIVNIENGIANKLFTEGKPIRSKIYDIIWQIDYYRNDGNPSGHSITQRIEFFKTGLNIFLRAPLFGTGTGDLNKEYELQYRLDKTLLIPSYRYQAHNQYLTFLISFGITGFLLISLCIAYPVIVTKRFNDYMFLIFSMIVLLSLFGEDEFETHTGISFFAYFYSLFIFGYEEGRS
jgi:hypothetical protein